MAPVVKKIKNPPANAGDVRSGGSIPGSGRSPGGENGKSFQYSCLENPVDRGTWQATVYSVRVGHDWSDLALTHAVNFKCYIWLNQGKTELENYTVVNYISFLLSLLGALVWWSLWESHEKWKQQISYLHKVLFTSLFSSICIYQKLLLSSHCPLLPSSLLSIHCSSQLLQLMLKNAF